MTFEMLESRNSGTIIKVIGVGGAGSNAVNHMINKDLRNVEFQCANTDAQALNKSPAEKKLQLGDSGLGAGAKPEIGKQAAENEIEKIKEFLEGAHMVFITAGMGGGTGTGAAPIIAQAAKEIGALTVAVVTKPFSFEGPKRNQVAEDGLICLEEQVDSLIVILNEKLEQVLGEDITQIDAFAKADDVLYNAVAGIAEIINVAGNVNVDFEDVRTVMSSQGKAMMGTAVAQGADRAKVAAEQATRSPLLEGVNLHGAKGILVNISASTNLKLRETSMAMAFINSFADKGADIIWGTAIDESLGDDLRVTLVATGIDRGKPILERVPLTGTDDSASVNANPIDSTIGDLDEMDNGGIDYKNEHLDDDSVFGEGSKPRNAAAEEIRRLRAGGMDPLDIPAFLRKQAD
tara:strand:- start:3099 stop:4313 length:1215 start_codon:yes stop_codon:yes gene_type:complete